MRATRTVVLLTLSIAATARPQAGQRGPLQRTTADAIVVEATIRGTRAALSAGTITCAQVVQAYIDRIKAYDEAGPALNAIITINPRALETAAEMDRLRAANRAAMGPLHCVPVIVKDN